MRTRLTLIALSITAALSSITGRTSTPESLQTEADFLGFITEIEKDAKNIEGYSYTSDTRPVIRYE